MGDELTVTVIATGISWEEDIDEEVLSTQPADSPKPKPRPVRSGTESPRMEDEHTDIAELAKKAGASRFQQPRNGYFLSGD